MVHLAICRIRRRADLPFGSGGREIFDVHHDGAISVLDGPEATDVGRDSGVDEVVFLDCVGSDGDGAEDEEATAGVEFLGEGV